MNKVKIFQDCDSFVLISMQAPTEINVKMKFTDQLNDHHTITDREKQSQCYSSIFAAGFNKPNFTR